MSGPWDNYRPGCEHFPGYNNGKRDLVYGGCDGSGHKHSFFECGGTIDLSSTINIYGNIGTAQPSTPKFSWGGFAGALTGSILGGVMDGIKLGLMAKWFGGGSSFGTTSLYSGLGTGASIFGGGFNSYGGGSGGFLIDSTGVFPYARPGFTGTVTYTG
ncbi:MAG: hypothetical protein NC200_01210, partial [Candidatus Gastranaerophilales bacterium]|nr:hypothetical protein [Candidatus Gastranaerophilales bacterium]